MATPPLFDSSQLTDYLQYPVSAEHATIAEQVVTGWLVDAIGSTPFPDPLPPQMFSWAIELGAIAHENPGGLYSETVGDKTTSWDRQRRAEILGYVKAWATGAAAPGAVPSPTGSFPKARPYPDPAERWPC